MAGASAAVVGDGHDVDEAMTTLNYSQPDSARSRRTASPICRIDASVPRLTTVGYVSVDYTACLNSLPEREERRLANEIVKSIGGATGQAIAAGLGQPFPVAASIITSIGLDQDSDWAAAGIVEPSCRSHHPARTTKRPAQACAGAG